MAHGSLSFASLYRQGWLRYVVLASILGSLLGPLLLAGIWDPEELQVAEFSRRIALALLGGEPHLALVDADNSVPIRRELGRGELPYLSIALGFKLFGLHDWAGRLPLAVWGLLGVAASYLLVRRFSGAPAGARSALLLAATPLYFAQSRTMLGDIVTMSATAIAVAGLSYLLFPQAGSRARAQVLGGLVAGLGLFCGYWSRGLMIGVALPTLSVGVAWLLNHRGSSASRATRIAGALVVALALLSTYVAIGALLRAGEADDYSTVLGTSVARPAKTPFDATLRHLAHGLFPMSALAPFALGTLLFSPREAEREGPDSGCEGGVLETILLLCIVFGVGAHALSSPVVGYITFAPVFAVAGAIAVALPRWTLPRASSRAIAMGIAALTVLLLLDFNREPDKAFSALFVNARTFPETFLSSHQVVFAAGALGFALLCLFSLGDSTERSPGTTFHAEYRSYLCSLKRAFGGNVWFITLSSGAALMLWALLTLVSDWRLHIVALERMGSVARLVAYNAWWLFVFVVFVAPLGMLLLRDAFSWWVHRQLGGRAARPGKARGELCLFGMVAFGMTLSLWYYPALANQISPKRVFVEYQRSAESGEPLAVLGVGSGVASYYLDEPVEVVESPAAGLKWLRQAKERRFIAVAAAELPKLNSLYRRESEPRENVAVINADSSEIVLVSNRLEPDEYNRNPFDKWIFSRRPVPSRPVQGNLGGKLDVLGWDLLNADGSIAGALLPGHRYQFAIYYEVTQRLTREWRTFVHIDGSGRRHHGDHDTLGGHYPMSQWLPGDFIADIHPVVVPPNFTPGRYQVYFGLYRGDDRLPVKSGRHRDNRLQGGVLEVR